MSYSYDYSWMYIVIGSVVIMFIIVGVIFSLICSSQNHHNGAVYVDQTAGAPVYAASPMYTTTPPYAYAQGPGYANAPAAAATPAYSAPPPQYPAYSDPPPPPAQYAAQSRQNPVQPPRKAAPYPSTPETSKSISAQMPMPKPPSRH